MNEQKQPQEAKCPHENIKMGWHGGHPYRFCLDCQNEVPPERPHDSNLRDEAENYSSYRNKYRAQEKNNSNEEADTEKFLGEKGLTEQPQEGALTAEEILLKAHNIERLTFSLRELVLPAMERYAAQQTASLREELAIVRKQHSDDAAENIRLLSNLDIAEENDMNLRVELTAARTELEAVKKERDSLKGTTTKSWVALNFERHEHKKIRDQLSEVTRQRDEAVDLLLKWRRDLIDGCGPANCIDEFLSRLSSGERRPASQWISVEERLPELTEPATWFNGETGLRESYRENDHATVWAYNPEMGAFKAEFSGKRWVEKSSISIRGDVKPTHWMPLPAPPESLT